MMTGRGQGQEIRSKKKREERDGRKEKRGGREREGGEKERGGFILTLVSLAYGNTFYRTHYS